MNKTETIAAFKAADIKQQDWEYLLIERIADLFARGYLDRRSDELLDGLSAHDEEYREEMLKACTWNIWGRS